MVSEKVTVINKMGFHMRPASVFVQAMAKYADTDINIVFNGKNIDGKSIMNVMAACMKCGSELEIQCSGPSEAAMLQEAAGMVKSGLGDPE